MREAQPLDLAVVGNCQVSALIDAQGRIVWMCLPRPDGDPVFSALLRRDLGNAAQGVFAVDLDRTRSVTQEYIHNTAILQTTLVAEDGSSIRITDFCPRHVARNRMYRPMMLVRQIEPLVGRPHVRVRFSPTAHYGLPVTGSDGSHHVSFDAAGVRYRLTTDAPLVLLADAQPTVLDRPLTFIVGVDEPLDDAPHLHAALWLESTLQYWQEWVRSLAIPFDWQDEVIRSAITLKLCTFEDSGAVLAALTTSIPESANSGRNWDYRFCWLRDAYLVVQALNRLGATRTMEGYLHYIDRIVARVGEVALQPVYRISGDEPLSERQIDSLEGYLGMGPVRIGNQAAQQTQHDVYGAVILALAQLFFDRRLVSPGDTRLFRELERLGHRARQVYEQPDAGPWEFRNTLRVHTFSAAMSWAGCDRLARIAQRLGLEADAARWRADADRIREEILSRAWNPQRQAIVATLDGGMDLDASLLLLPELGLVQGTDPRFVATVDTIGRELREGDLIFRYRHADDFGRPEVAFTVCAFWYVNALAASGRMAEAREMFSSLLKRRNHVGLLSEDIHPESGLQWGNFPQTYSMVGVISCALRLSQSWDAAL